jgi:hypothetical protein
MTNVNKWLRRDPVTPLLKAANPAVAYFARRDLLGERVGPVETLWELPLAAKLFRRQQPEGSWKYPGGREEIRSREDYNQIETYRNLGFLVELHGCTRRHPGVAKAAQFLFRCQTPAGDFRGIYGTQYTPNYSAGIMELLIKAGFGNDPRIARGFQWLLSIRQDDSGWAIPFRTRGIKLDIEALHGPIVEPDRARPFSWMVTGVVLRAFAAHPRWRRSPHAKKAAGLLAGRILQRDNYTDRGTPAYWTRFTFPFWFTDLLSALDSLSMLGFHADHPRIAEAMQWFADHQDNTGLWRPHILKNKHIAPHLWLALALCRAAKRLDLL